MAQFARPDNDFNNPDSYTNQAGSGVDIFQAIDETSFDDADYVRSPLVPTADVYVARLSDVVDPLVSTGHVLRYRYGKDAAAGGQVDITVELRQGYVSEASQGTLIKQIVHTNVGSGFTQNDYTLSGAEADAITNYSDLFVRIVSNQV
jgi:hypothetical protein